MLTQLVFFCFCFMLNLAKNYVINYYECNSNPSLMYEHDRTTNTCACINAIANSKPEKAIIKAKGNNPKKKNIIPDVIML